MTAADVRIELLGSHAVDYLPASCYDAMAEMVSADPEGRVVERL